jgi:hypothetical protein
MLRLKQKVVLRRGSGFALAESPGAACLSRSCATLATECVFSLKSTEQSM